MKTKNCVKPPLLQPSADPGISDTGDAGSAGGAHRCAGKRHEDREWNGTGHVSCFSLNSLETHPGELVSIQLHQQKISAKMDQNGRSFQSFGANIEKKKKCLKSAPSTRVWTSFFMEQKFWPGKFFDGKTQKLTSMLTLGSYLSHKKTKSSNSIPSPFYYFGHLWSTLGIPKMVIITFPKM